MNPSAKTYIETGNTLKEQGKLDQAIANYQQALKIEPNNALAYNQMGEIYVQQGKLDAAIAACQNAIKIKPNLAAAYKNLGNALQAGGKIEEAIRAYSKAVEIDPQFAEAYANLGSMLGMQGQMEKAIAYFQKALEIKPNIAAVHWNLGNALNKVKRVSEAIACWRRAAEYNPQQFSAEAINDRGSMCAQAGKFAEAMDNYQRAIQIKPEFALAYLNLGTVQQKQGKIDDAIAQFNKVLELKPDCIEAYGKLGNLLIGREKFDEAIAQYQKVIQIQPDAVEAHFNFGTALLEQGKIYQAIAAFQKVLELQPNNAEAYSNLGVALYRQFKQSDRRNINQFDAAFNNFQKAIEINPNLLAAHLGISELINNSIILLSHNSLAHLRKAAETHLQNCGETAKIIATTTFINVYLKSALHQIAQEKFLEIEPLIYNAELSEPEITSLYAHLLFNLNYLRDDRAANSKLSKYIGERYAELIAKAYSPINLPQNPRPDRLKIGILSAHFRRHSVSWCSGDIIQELSKLTPHLYLYSTSQYQPDDRTQLFEKVAKKFYKPSKFTNGNADPKEIIEQILQDELDVLIELDSITIPLQVDIIYQQPARLCLSWLGFEAPFTSEKNYFLGDAHTEPEKVEEYYREQLIRMPDSFVAVGGFECLPVDRKNARRGLRIAEDQVIYLCVSPAYKLNAELIKAQVQILKQVPDSVLIYKGHTGDIEIIQAAYKKECEAIGVGLHRVKYLLVTKTEEEHRTNYKIADILLDSYPYNGGTHNLEALWFNLPIVTRSGEQYLSRMGYSFLQTLGISAGIANSWEEYIDWGVKLGKDRELRQKIQQQLVESKQPETLSPLWNPKKFAQDMYEMLEKLLK